MLDCMYLQLQSYFNPQLNMSSKIVAGTGSVATARHAVVFFNSVYDALIIVYSDNPDAVSAFKEMKEDPQFDLKKVK
jgi:hypothetical protein